MTGDVLAQRIRSRRQQVSLSQSELARRLNMNRSSVSNWEGGRFLPSVDMLPALARELRTTVDYLLGLSEQPLVEYPEADGADRVAEAVDRALHAHAYLIRDAIESLDTKVTQALELSGGPAGSRRPGGGRVLPILGEVPAGPPREVFEEAEDALAIPGDWLKLDERGFLLRVQGDSMVPTLLQGDLVVVRIQPAAASGDIVVAVVDGKTVIKRLIRAGGRVRLGSDNPVYGTLDLDLDAAVNGKVVGCLRHAMPPCGNKQRQVGA